MAESRRQGQQFVVIDGRLFNRDHVIAVTNKAEGVAVVTTQTRDIDVDVPFAEVVRLLTHADEETD